MIIITTFYIFWRLCQLLFLIPLVGMLAWFVDGFIKANRLTPNYVLILFIVSVLAAVWDVATLIKLNSVKRNSYFVSFVDLCFVGGFIAGVYSLRNIATVSCSVFTSGKLNLGQTSQVYNGVPINVTRLTYNFRKTCSMLKTCFAFGIILSVFFLLTSFLISFMKSHNQRKSSSASRKSSSHHHHHHHRGNNRSSLPHKYRSSSAHPKTTHRSSRYQPSNRRKSYQDSGRAYQA